MRYIVYLLLLTITTSAQIDDLAVLASGSDLRKGLVGYWSLEELSGVRYDRSQYGNHLTDGNTVGQASGKVRNCATFTSASSQYLSHADNASLSVLDNFEMHCWVMLTTKTADMTIASQWDSASNQRGWILQYVTATDRFRFVASTDGTSSSGVLSASTFGSPSTNVWYHILIKKDSSMGISVNNGLIDTAVLAGNLFNSSAPFYIGAIFTTPAGFLNGKVDEFGIWNRTLSDAQRTSVYSSGLGTSFPWINSFVVPYSGGTLIAVNGDVTRSHHSGQHSAVVSYGVKQFVFYENSGFTNAGVQYDPSTGWSSPIPIGWDRANDPDHNYLSAAADSTGYVYMFYGCHNSPLYYRRTTNPADLSSLTTETTITTESTYPEAVVDQADTIYVFFRSGAGGQNYRTLSYIKSFDKGTNWTSQVDVVDSLTSAQWVYSRVGIGNDAPQNSLHISWTMRYNLGPNDPTAFTNIYYAKSLNGGTNWTKSTGVAYTLPITPGNEETVYAGNCVLGSQIGMTTNNNPLLLFLKSDTTSYFTNSAYMLADINSGSWNVQQVPGGTNYNMHGQIAVDASDHFSVFGSTPVSGIPQMLMVRSTDAGSTWSQQFITSSAVPVVNPAVANGISTGGIPLSWNAGASVYYGSIQ